EPRHRRRPRRGRDCASAGGCCAGGTGCVVTTCFSMLIFLGENILFRWISVDTAQLWVALNIWHWIVRIIMIPMILRRRFNPPVATAWLGLIFFVPDVGLVAYLLIG